MSLVGISPLDTLTASGSLQSGRGFGLGDRVTADHEGRAYVYVQASTALAAGDLASFTTAFEASALSTANDARGNLCGVANVAFAAGDFGWLQVRGAGSVNVLANCAANVRLNTTATAGKLDDDGTVGSMQVQGVYLTVANGAGTNARACILNDPFVDVTI